MDLHNYYAAYAGKPADLPDPATRQQRSRAGRHAN